MNVACTSAALAALSVGLAFSPGSALAQADITARTSTLRDWFYNGSPQSYDETVSFTGAGQANLVIRNARHSFLVSGSAFRGRLAGGFSRSQRYTESGTVTTLDTTFTIAREADISINLNGSVFPGGDGAADPLRNNAYFLLTRTSGAPAVVFDAFTQGAPTPPGDYGAQQWSNTTWHGVLTPGTYHLVGGGNGRFTFGAGSGNDFGSGSLTVDMTLTPRCLADFNGDGFLDLFDYAAFVDCFETGACGDRSADFNGDGFADFFDYADFVAAYEAGC